jgi:Rrf2 family iron-sulfur cluster assembly transcriptional regulator
MLYSKTAKYAVLALAEVALCPPGQPISTKQIAASSSVPYPLLAKIVGQMRRAGLVSAARGKHGGIFLTRPANEITIQDVVIALDGPDVLNDCPLFLTPCNCEKECTLHPLWDPARAAVVKFFEGTTLQDIADARLEAKQSGAR